MLAAILPALARTLIGVLPSGTHLGCAMCAQNLATSGQNGLIEGLRWSMLLLLAAPALMIGGFVWMLVRAHRRTHPQPATAPAAVSGDSIPATSPLDRSDRVRAAEVDLPALQHPA
ncbi:MAG: hypothetical protein ACREJ2_04760 [Planctomycetota bacterium]